MKDSKQSVLDNKRTKVSIFSKLYNWTFAHRKACSHSFKQLWATPVASFITMGVIAVVMTLPVGLYWMTANLSSITQGWHSGGELTLFLNDNVLPEQALGLQNQLKFDQNISKVNYLSPEQALAEFQSMTNTGDVLVALEQNPLPGVMIVEPVYMQPHDLQMLKAELARLPEVAMAQLDMAWIMRLQAILGMLEQLVLTLAVLLGIGLLFVVGNITRSAIAQREDEITVTKLVGASNRYVRRPFLYMGFWYGLLGGVFSLVIVMGIGHTLAPAFNSLLETYASTWQPLSLGLPTILAVIGIAILFSVTGAWLAVGRHLRQMRPR